ncbi:MAG: flavodoxin [Erysipelotrichaceae bacterium]|nr:flavodoxin [Erysipelotrichaceae bacterium]
MKILTAYYSRAGENYFGGQLKMVRTGNTEKAAKMIAEKTGSDLFKIEQAVPYSNDYKICVKEARKDFEQHARPRLACLPDSLDEYDVIFLGYPNYMSTMPMAVYTFLESFDWNGKTIIPFCTHEGSGLANTEYDIANSSKGAAVLKGLAVNGSRTEALKPEIEQWCQKSLQEIRQKKKENI